MSRDTILTDETGVRHAYDNLRTQGWLDGHASGLDDAAEFPVRASREAVPRREGRRGHAATTTRGGDHPIVIEDEP
jgi:hypothetical protein